MRYITIPSFIKRHDKSLQTLSGEAEKIRHQIKSLHSAEPEISIVIPAFNEAENVLKTLSSLAATTTQKRIEIIVVDNNSTDETGKLIHLAGAMCVTEPVQGITAARNAGLKAAKGRYILNADADTIYPPNWIDRMTAPLHAEEVGMVYGTFSFIPTMGTSRLVYSTYEYLSDFSKWINKQFREEAVNIYGFNSAFRRNEGLQVNGFDHPPGTNEDGWLGVKLRSQFNKKFYHVTSADAIVWTTDRRIQIDGGLLKGIAKRLRKHLRF